MDNFKCLTVFYCDDLNKKDMVVSVDFFYACETLRKELLKSMKIAKKFKEQLKLANLEKDELIMRLVGSGGGNGSGGSDMGSYQWSCGFICQL